MHTDSKKSISGFTLVETVITMTILTIAAVGIVGTLITIQYTSQDSLYGSTALTVAMSTLEQMKSMDSNALENSINTSSFNLITSVSGEVTLNLSQENQIQVPIVTNDDGNQTMPITLIPNMQTLENDNGFLLEVGYEYKHPRNGRLRTETVRCIRSRIANY